jgi:Protein of unknown function (DUF3313)
MTSVFPLHDFHNPAPSKAVLVFALTAVLALSGCASVSAPEKSSTLASFEQLAVQPDGTRTWRSSAADKVSVVRIEPQAITFSADVQLEDEQRQPLRKALLEALTKRFSEAGVRVATAADAQAVLVRVNVTAVELASPALNVVSAIVLLVPVSRGGISVEIEAFIANDRQRVAAMAFSGTAGVYNVGSAFSAIGHAELQTDVAATKFVALVMGAAQK